jgi:hypothetical protein
MLEILFLVWFCKKLASIATAKNRSGSWGALGALGWIGGEILGFVLGSDALDRGGDLFDVYPMMLGCAGAGAVLAWIVVSTLKPIPRDGELPVARIV